MSDNQEKKQKLEWGSVDWIYEPAEDSADHMRVGISHMNPGTYQTRHIHYGDEQMIYIISGQGKQKIGDVEYTMEPGKVFHISSGMAHESSNDGEEPIVKLLVSIPAITAAPKVRRNESERVKKQESVDPKAFLRDTVKEMFRSMLTSLRMPLAIFDADNELVYRTYDYPTFCRNHCGVREDVNRCPLIGEKPHFTPPIYEGVSACACQYGLWVYTLPIVAEDEFLGYIQAGHIRTGASVAVGEVPKDLPYQTPDSTVLGIIEVMNKLSESIRNHYSFCRMQAALSLNTRELSDQRKADILLQESLKTSQDQAFNLQINQHFLFNTLSTIASMAIKEDAMETYQAVGDLAQLLRYTLRTDSNFVPLSKELEYVRNYLNLQKLRFGKRLEVNYEILGGLEEEQVPFNFLQPVAENCFKHAFKDSRDKMKILIRVDADAEYLYFTVRDNGKGMTKERVAQLQEKIATSKSDRGTTMVVGKLRSLYGDKVSYDIDSNEKGTTVRITIPREEKKHRAQSIIG